MINKAWLMTGVVGMALLAGCDKPKSPDAVAKDVAAAQQSADQKVAKAENSAAQDVGKAADTLDSKAVDLNNTEAKAAYDIAVARAEGDRKVALAKCSALAGDDQSKCRKQADADYDAVKANVKAGETALRQ